MEFAANATVWREWECTDRNVFNKTRDNTVTGTPETRRTENRPPKIRQGREYDRMRSGITP